MKLRPQTGSLYTTYPGVRLYLDDLEHLIRVSEDAGYTVKVSDDTFEYESLAEVREKRGVRPSHLEIEGHKSYDAIPDVSVHINRAGGRLYAHNPDRIGDLQYRLPEFLKSRQLLLSTLLDFRVWTGLAVLWLFLSASGWRLDRGGVDVSMNVLVVIAAIAVIGLAFRFSFQGVWLSRRHEGGFFKRNADRLWLLLAGVVLGSLFAWIVGLLAGR